MTAAQPMTFLFRQGQGMTSMRIDIQVMEDSKRVGVHFVIKDKHRRRVWKSSIRFFRLCGELIEF